MNETSAIRLIARIAPWLAPIPSGYFVARSSFHHLLSSDGPFLAYPVAVIIGLMMEMLGVASVHTLQDLNRWNRQPNVRRDGGWEKAPTGAAWLAVLTYFGGTFALLFVLETVANAARVAPFLFPLVAIAGATVWSVRNQHDERKERYGVDETLRPGSLAERQERRPLRPESEPERTPTPEPTPGPLVPLPPFTCPVCGKGHASQQALAGHMKAHRNGRSHDPEQLEVVARALD